VVRKDKLLNKLRSSARTFTFAEMETLLSQLGYVRSDKGRTSGSRVMFVNERTHAKVILHKPHPQKELPGYQVRQIAEHLRQEGLL